MEPFQPGQFAQVDESRIADARPTEIERFQSSQISDVKQRGIVQGTIGAQVQHPQLSQPADVTQTLVRQRPLKHIDTA